VKASASFTVHLTQASPRRHCGDLGLAVLAPLLFVIAAIVWLESRGPIRMATTRKVDGRGFDAGNSNIVCRWHAAQKDLKAIDKMDGPHQD
jgi:hypothetical protein